MKEAFECMSVYLSVCLEIKEEYGFPVSVWEQKHYVEGAQR